MIHLETIEGRVQGERGKVFSTRPEIAIGADGRTYYIKGCNSAVAFSEVAGCRLAALAGLRVPPAYVGNFDADLYAAVEEVPNAQRNIRPWLHHRGRVNDWDQVFEVIAVDTWLANDDRNMGNIVGSSDGRGRLELYMIDFERSRTLGEFPTVTTPTVDPRRFWPTEELGCFLRSIRPPSCPEAIIGRISSFRVDTLNSLLSEVAEELPFITWHQSSAELLASRARNIT